MPRTLFVPFFVAILALGTVCAALSQNTQAPSAPLTLEKLKDDLYVIRGEGGNITVYLTDEGVILVDDKFERHYDELMEKIRSLTDQPVRYVFNTHPHRDHSGGNVRFLPSATIIAHENARAAMIRGDQPGVPQVTYSDELTIHLGGKEVIAYRFAPCHTDGDTFVYFPEAAALATGDCFNTGNGQGVNLTGSSTFSFYIDYRTGGSFAGRERTGDEALKLDFDTVVPGHGPVTDKAGFARWRSDTDAIRTRITEMLRQGRGKDEIVMMLVSDFGWDSEGRTVQASMDGIIAELQP